MAQFSTVPCDVMQALELIVLGMVSIIAAESVGSLMHKSLERSTEVKHVVAAVASSGLVLGTAFAITWSCKRRLAKATLAPAPAGPSASALGTNNGRTCTQCAVSALDSRR
jgi:hypothetical protein